MVLLDDPRIIHNKDVFSTRLDGAMKAKSYSASTLATVLELQGGGAKWNPDVIQKWIDGERSPRFCVVVILAEALGVSPNYLAGLTENKSSNILKEEAKEVLGLEMLSDEAIDVLSAMLKEKVDRDDLSDISLLLADSSRWNHLNVRPTSMIDEAGLIELLPSISIVNVIEYSLTHFQETIRRILRSAIRIMEYFEVDSFSDVLEKKEAAELNNSNSEIMKSIKEIQEQEERFEEHSSKLDMLEKIKKGQERHKEKIVRERVVEEAILEDAIRSVIRKCWEERVNGQSDTKSNREEFADSMIGVVAQSLSNRICTLKRLRDIQSKE